MAVIRSNLGWKVKDFRGMSFEEIKANFTTVWKQLEDFIPMGSKEEAERLKRKCLSVEQKSVKKLKPSDEVPEEVKSPDEVPEEKGKEMTQLVPIEEVYVEALQVKHPIINWKGRSEPVMGFSEGISQQQNLMHAPVEWKLYDMCGVHQVTSKDKEIFMLVEKDYPLRKGLALVMICYKLQVENYSQMANDLILKIYKIANCPSQQVIEFPLAEEVPTASEESCHCQKKREATTKRIALLGDRGLPRWRLDVCGVRDDPTLEPSNCKIKRFEMMKYSFNIDKEYIAIKESEYLNHSKDNLDAYRELLRKRGLRKGDPLSPYLFTIIIEVLTLMLRRRVRKSNSFEYHRYCFELELINLCFADDLFLFTHRDANSASVIMEALDEFKFASGLTPSLPKSTTYFCNVLNHIKISILHILPFEEGRLLVKYLGVPLVSSRLFIRIAKSSLKRIGAGLEVSLWSDHWCTSSPLSLIVLARDIHNAGFNLDTKVKDAICNGCWTWPPFWNTKYPALTIVAVPYIDPLVRDSLEWCSNIGVMPFSFNMMWNCIRPRNEMVAWSDVIWFSKCIPRHAFDFLLVLKRKLKTQDTLGRGDVGSSLSANQVLCPLCGLQADSHEHLFFECTFPL
nr:reverse transcriptase domain, reverse transcriptase zinc-binding domain protein [Tanacetum cinerariifolium]